MVSDVVVSVTIKRRPGGREELADAGRGGCVVRPDHDAVGVEAVVHRGTLAEELRIRHDPDVEFG